MKVVIVCLQLLMLGSVYSGICASSDFIMAGPHDSRRQTVLITGGAGYIGSHTAYVMAQRGYRVLVLDDLWYGHKFNAPWAECIKGDFGDAELLDTIFSENAIDAVIHLGAF